MMDTLDCGHAAAPTRLTPGYATTSDGRTVCYPCADELTRADIATSRVFGAYVAADGRHVTTWTGGLLARITEHGYSRAAGFGHGLHYYRARTPDGRVWHGRNGEGAGMYITMREVKP